MIEMWVMELVYLIVFRLVGCGQANWGVSDNFEKLSAAGLHHFMALNVPKCRCPGAQLMCSLAFPQLLTYSSVVIFIASSSGVIP